MRGLTSRPENLQIPTRLPGVCCQRGCHLCRSLASLPRGSVARLGAENRLGRESHVNLTVTKHADDSAAITDHRDTSPFRYSRASCLPAGRVVGAQQTPYPHPLGALTRGGKTQLP